MYVVNEIFYDPPRQILTVPTYGHYQKAMRTDRNTRDIGRRKGLFLAHLKFMGIFLSTIKHNV